MENSVSTSNKLYTAFVILLFSSFLMSFSNENIILEKSLGLVFVFV
jgi:hypothetical protein